uniref:Uncharacterized protein n=1 Tax=Molossus molossus TaxID=27622 RepID=A0A7J8FSW1_MOLMO|nr:hypothetical protein HJG59_008383 [Molossus molossus]
MNLMCWPFKSVSVFLAVCSCWTEPLVLFTTRCLVGTFPGSATLGWSVLIGVLALDFSGGNHAAEIPLWNFSCCLCVPNQPSCTFAISTRLDVGSSLHPRSLGFSPASVQLVIPAESSIFYM